MRKILSTLACFSLVRYGVVTRAAANDSQDVSIFPSCLDSLGQEQVPNNWLMVQEL